MKNASALGKILIVAGLLILVGLGLARAYAATHRGMQSFDDFGNWVAVPFLGTVLVTAGLFLLAFSGNGKNL